MQRQLLKGQCVMDINLILYVASGVKEEKSDIVMEGREWSD